MRDTYRIAKGQLCGLFEAAHSPAAKSFWAKRIAWCDKKLKQRRSREIELARRLKFLVIIVNVLVLFSIIMTTTGCGTVKGMAGDAGWILTKMSENITVEGEK